MKITKIERQKKNQSRLSIFIDGSFSFGISEADAALYGLEEGTTISESDYDGLVTELVIKRARFLALKYLSYSNRTEKEVCDKLRSYDEFDENVIAGVIVFLKEQRLVNDEAYSASYALSKSGRLDGPLKIKYGLISRGIAPKAAEKALAELEIDEAGNASSLILKKTKGKPPTFAEKRKIYNYLAQKGYSSSAINEAFRLAGNETEWND